MPKFVGLEINEARLRALELETSSKKVAVTGLCEVAIQSSDKNSEDNGQSNNIISAVKKLFADNKLQKDGVAISLDAGNALIRELHIPFKGDDRIKKVVKYELESVIHNYSVDEIVVDYYKVSETEKGTSILVFAIPKSILSNELDILQEAGVDPAFIDLDVTAILNTFYTIGAIDTDEPFVIVHSSDKFTKLIFIENRKPSYIRSIRSSLSDNSQSPEALDGMVEIVAKELSRFLLSATAKTPLFMIVTSSSTDIHEALQQKTGITVKPLKLSDNGVEYKLPSGYSAEQVLVPLGLALKCADTDKVGIDFRKEEFTYKKKFEVIKIPTLVAGAATILLLAGVLFNILSMKSKVERAYTTVLNAQKEEYEAITKSKPSDINTIFSDIQKLFRDKMEKIGGGEYPLEKSSLIIWRELYEAISKFRQKELGVKKSGEELYLLLTSVSIEQSKGKITLKGELTNRSYADALKKILSDTFGNAEFPASLDNAPNGRVRFTIEVKLEKYKV